MPALFMDALGLSAKMESELVGSSPLKKDVSDSGNKLKHERSTTDDSLWDGVDRDDEMIQKQEQEQKNDDLIQKQEQENNDRLLSPPLFACGRTTCNAYKNSDDDEEDTFTLPITNAKQSDILAVVTPTEVDDDEMSFGSLCSDEVENDDESPSSFFACGSTTCDAYETSDDEESFTLPKQRKKATTIQDGNDDDEMSFGSLSSEEVETYDDESSYSGSLVMLCKEIPERKDGVVSRHSSGSSSESNPLVDESRSQNSGGQTMRKGGPPSVDETRDGISASPMPVVERKQEQQEHPAPSTTSTKNWIWKKKGRRGIFSSFNKTSKKKSAVAVTASPKKPEATTPAESTRVVGLERKEEKGKEIVVLLEQVYEPDFRGRLIAKTSLAELVGSIDPSDSRKRILSVLDGYEVVTPTVRIMGSHPPFPTVFEMDQTSVRADPEAEATGYVEDHQHVEDKLYETFGNENCVKRCRKTRKIHHQIVECFLEVEGLYSTARYTAACIDVDNAVHYYVPAELTVKAETSGHYVLAEKETLLFARE